MEIGETLRVSDRAAWREWLEKNHGKKTEIWLAYPLKASGEPRVPYEAAVEEALCFGWIDGVQKKLDAQTSVQRFTPRKKRGSNWSELNKARARRLIAAGQMTDAGLSALGNALEADFVVSANIQEALQADPQTAANWNQFPDDYRRVRVGYVEDARKQPAEFQKRLANLVRMTAQNKTFGSWK